MIKVVKKIILGKRSTLIAGFLLLISPSAFSWDATSHRVISAIAYNHLAPAAKNKIDTFTNLLDPGYSPLLRFLYISTLPDVWRQKDQGLSASWHFINLPWSADGSDTQSTRTNKFLKKSNLIDAFLANKKTLLNISATDMQKAIALAYVIHLTEDAHQPLHCINQFSQKFPQGDQGGNLFSIKTKHAKQLHAYWDQSARLLKQTKNHYPLNTQQVMQLAQTIEENYPEDIFVREGHDFSVTNWTAESYVIAKTKVYDLTLGSKPSATYKRTMEEIAAQQIALAGYRLAGVLNELF